MSELDLTSPWQMPRAQLQWSETGEPFSTEFGDIYFSRGDGLAETDYVFLQQNRLEQRWRALDPATSGVFVIGETGFGSGLNFLCAWQLWRHIAPKSWRLHFVSVEKYPLDHSTLQRALSQWPQFAELSAPLLAAYPALVPGFHRRELGDSVTLQLLFDDATHALDALCDSAAPELANGFHMDAWFLDGFAPAKNPHMWNDLLFQHIGRLSRADTTFATFTVAGIVKRGLQNAGFAIEKIPGFGAKRQMLRGDFIASPADIAAPLSASVSHPIPVARTSAHVRAIDYWATPPIAARSDSIRHVAVIGGGLAGTSTAYALVKRGCRVTLCEQDSALASAASGNPQGVLYTKLSAQAGVLNRFTLASYLHALAFYHAFIADGATDDSAVVAEKSLIEKENALGQFCGVLQLAETDTQWQQLRTAFHGHEDWVQFVDNIQASALAQCQIPTAALWFPQAGWLRPAQLCRALASHALIDIRTNCRVNTLEHDAQRWRLDTSSGTVHADAVVIANAHAATQFAVTADLPLKSIRGQITNVPKNYFRQTPATVICHDGYLTPSLSGANPSETTIGATFDLHDNDPAVRIEDHRHNLHTLQRALPDLLAIDPAASDCTALTGRVGFRCTTPDYLPIVGPVPDAAWMRTRFAPLADNAQRVIAKPGAYLPDLYVNVGHGSRGLTSTPLCAELLASLICGEPRPLPRDLVQALSPARFLIRKLIRG